MVKAKTYLIAIFNIVAGVLLGLALLEALLQTNPALLLRGMDVPAPVDPPLSDQTYAIHYSDADLFYWQPDWIRPLSPGEDQLETRVHYQTDEFGFPNPYPLPPTVNVVVLGRSYAMGAQAGHPWPRLLSETAGLHVLNLSQTGSDLRRKGDYWREFGLPRQPRWVIVEILPSMDILPYGPPPESHFTIQDLPVPVLQQIGRQMGAGGFAWKPSEPFYPLAVDIAGRQEALSFFAPYVAGLTVDRQALAASSQWRLFSADLLALAAEVRAQGACPVLLYVPTRPDIYFPLADHPEQLAPALQGWSAWGLDPAGRLAPDPGLAPDLAAMQANAPQGRDLLAAFAQERGLLLVDPSPAMGAAALRGDHPFMTYDTHWSDLGHQLVAEALAATLHGPGCNQP